MKSNTKEVRTGFRFQDEQYLKRFYNAASDPDVQIFTNEEEEAPQTRQYYCAMDKSRLEYHKHLGIWICPECYQQYDPKIQDRPITNKEFKIRPWHDINRYPKMDSEDPDVPFIKAINVDEQIDSDIEIIRQSESGRIKHIRLVDKCTREEAYNKTRDL